MTIEEARKLINELSEKGFLEPDDRFKISEVLFEIQEEVEALFELLNDVPGSPEEEDAGLSVQAIKQVEDITLLSLPNALLKDVIEKKADETILKKYTKAIFVAAGKNLGVATAKKTEKQLLENIKKVVEDELR